MASERHGMTYEQYQHAKQQARAARERGRRIPCPRDDQAENQPTLFEIES